MMQRMLKAGCIGLFCLVLQLSANAQEIKVTSGFIKDSVAIGEPVTYYLTARYPESVMALFPDSTFSFNPFEFSKKAFFPTKTTNGTSYDSAVYELRTFEIDQVQFLSLPVYVTTSRDCTAFESERDSIFLIEQIKIPASDTTALKNLSLKSNTLYERVSTQLNTFILMIVLGVLVIAAIIGWIFFGKRIIRYYKIKKLEKKYKKFIADFNLQLSQLTELFSPEQAEKTLLIWKTYMEGLSKVPYTKYTTREIKEAFTDTTIGPPLASIDRMIYGQIKPESFDSFKELRSEADRAYQDQITQPEKVSKVPAKTILRTPKSETVLISTVKGQAPIQYTIADINEYAGLLRQLPCPYCQRTTQPLNANTIYTVKSIIFLTRYRKDPVIACPDCLTKKHNQAILSTSLLGWWGVPWGLIRTPHYIYLNMKAKKQNRNSQPNDVLLAIALRDASQIEAHKNDPEVLKQIIKPKSWWRQL